MQRNRRLQALLAEEDGPSTCAWPTDLCSTVAPNTASSHALPLAWPRGPGGLVVGVPGIVSVPAPPPPTLHLPLRHRRTCRHQSRHGQPAAVCSPCSRRCAPCCGPLCACAGGEKGGSPTCRCLAPSHAPAAHLCLRCPTPAHPPTQNSRILVPHVDRNYAAVVLSGQKREDGYYYFIHYEGARRAVSWLFLPYPVGAAARTDDAQGRRVLPPALSQAGQTSGTSGSRSRTCCASTRSCCQWRRAGSRHGGE